MPPIDDVLGHRLLGQVQELRAALDRLNDRAEARALKARLITLHDASRGITVAPDVGRIVDEFFTMARDLIVKGYGTAAWDEPETIEEAKARMGKLPAAPQTQTPDLDEIKALRESIAGASSAPTLPVRRVLLAALIPDWERLRSDEWLQRAVDDIGALDTLEGHVDLAKALAILRKHRDGKA